MLLEPYVRFHILGYVRVAAWPPTEKYLLTRITIFFLSISN